MTTVSSTSSSHEQEETAVDTPSAPCWSFKDLTYTVGKGIKRREILKDLTGIIQGARLTALMGSTGAGKSTFIDILAGRNKSGKITGTVRFCNYPTGLYNKIGAYVLQQDLIMPTQSVREVLMFYGNLHLNLSQEEKAGKVEGLIETLGLTHCADTLVGSELIRGISGGELKRLSIGVSLITDPRVIILDEPTSGLDSFNALAIMKLLKEMTSRGITILCTIHQPSSDIFAEFDDLVLLHRGKLAYLGSARKSIHYMASVGFKCPRYYNPADYFMAILIQQKDEEDSKYLPTLWDGSIERQFFDQQVSKEASLLSPARKKSSSFASSFGSSFGSFRSESEVHSFGENSNIPEKYLVNRYYQYLYLLERNYYNTLRDPRTTFAKLGQTLFISILIGTLYFRMPFHYSNLNDRFGVLFFVIIDQAFGCVTSLTKFLEERPLFQRERAASNYYVLPYFLSRSTLEVPFLVIFTLIMSSIVYWLCNLHPGASQFFIFWCVLMMVNAVSVSLFGTLSAICPKAELALILAPVTLVLFFLFGGFFINTANIPPWYSWFGYLSFFRYATRILCLNEYTGSVYACDTNSTACGGVNGTYYGEQQLEILGMSGDHMWNNFLVLVGMVIGFKILTFVAIYFLHKEQR